MDMYKLKFTRLQCEIFRVLCVKAGTALNQRELSGLLDVSPTAIAKALKRLEKEGIVKVDRSKTMNLNSVSLNRDDQKVLIKKRIENMAMVYGSGLVDFLEEKFPGAAIVLFGSYARGDDTIKSDIDIAVLGTKQKELDLAAFDKQLERKIFLHCYESLKQFSKEMKESIINGIVLAGGIRL